MGGRTGSADKSLVCTQYKYLSGCTWSAGACSGSNLDGLPCNDPMRATSEKACMAYGRGEREIYVNVDTSSGCTWSPTATRKCTGTGTNTKFPACTHSSRTTEALCTRNYINSTATYNGCVFDDISTTKACKGGYSLATPD